MKSLRQILQSDDIIVSAGTFDPLSCRAAQRAGFSSAILAGWSVGAHLGITEPLTTLTEMADITRNICRAAEIPLTVDAGAAFGDGPMVKRCVQVFEDAGAQGIHIEDQVVPKRMDYHQGKHFIISLEEMMRKLECALSARKSKDFIIVARTDAGRNEGETFKNAIERANIYASSGVDLVKVFARNEEEMILAPKKINAPLWYVASEGLGRPIPTPQEAKAMGYKAISYPQTALLSAYGAYTKVYQNIIATGKSGISPEEAKRLADEILALISIDELASLEKQMEADVH